MGAARCLRVSTCEYPARLLASVNRSEIGKVSGRRPPIEPCCAGDVWAAICGRAARWFSVVHHTVYGATPLKLTYHLRLDSIPMINVDLIQLFFRMTARPRPPLQLHLLSLPLPGVESQLFLFNPIPRYARRGRRVRIFPSAHPCLSSLVACS